MQYDFIESPSNLLIKDLLKQSRKKGTFARHLCLDGISLLQDAMDTHQTIDLIVTSHTQIEHVMALLTQFDIEQPRIVVTSDSIMQRIAPTETPSGILSYCLLLTHHEKIDYFHTQRLLYLDAVQDPGNVGTLIRTAAALDMDAVLLSPGSASPSNPKTIRSSMGAIFRIPIFLQVTAETLSTLPHKKVIADLGGEHIISFKWPNQFVLVLGNEGHGPSADIRALADHTLTIPMANGVDSLNVSVAGSMMLFTNWMEINK